MKKILFIAGTRPEAIKLAPLYLEMRRRSVYAPVFCSTGQHPSLFEGALAPFGVVPDLALQPDVAGGALPQKTSELFREVGAALEEQRPDMVIVQGDTLSAYVGAWSAFLSRIPVLHVEAGLRTGCVSQPFPEEANRRAISLVAQWHAAPTEGARQSLLGEGIPREHIAVTGNTAIDALFHVRDRLEEQRLDQTAGDIDPRKQVLITCHRRENIGAGLKGICEGIARLAKDFPDVRFTWVAHPNPEVSEHPRRVFDGCENVRVIEPLNYEEFVRRLTSASLVITDSGGLQEECPALGIPVLVTRVVTERPEAVEVGAARLVGTQPDTIYDAASLLLRDQIIYTKMASAGSPYGDGTASAKICDFLEDA